MKFNKVAFINCSKHRHLINRWYSQNVVDSSEYNDTPQYPPILDLSLDARKIRSRNELHGKIGKLNTIEEKALAINLPRYYGFKTVMMPENRIPFNAMPLVQHYTRTHFVNTITLPDFYKEYEAVASEFSKELSDEVKDALSFEYQSVRRNLKADDLERGIDEQKKDESTKYVVSQINRILMNSLCSKIPHLIDTQVDIDPRHEAFWFVGGVEPELSVKKSKEGRPYTKPLANRSVNRAVQYIGKPILTLRNNLPLRQVTDFDEAKGQSNIKIPKFKYHPQTSGFHTTHRHGTNIPGFWPGDADEFGLISYHGRGHILERKKSYGPEDNLEALHCQSMLSGFGWLAAQATYQGFTTFNDITYPLVSQLVITDGQLWSFYVYQMNTMLIHGEYAFENPKFNWCFGTQPLKLFEGFDQDGKVIGFNEDVMKLLIQFYMNSPESKDCDMKPYLGSKEKIAADIENPEKRVWVDNTYKHLMSNRPRHRLPYEIYHWEKIYKIDHDTRFIEPRRRPFSLGINPYSRKLNEYTPQYIPKVLRPYPRHGKKFVKTFWPEL